MERAVSRVQVRCSFMHSQLHKCTKCSLITQCKWLKVKTPKNMHTALELFHNSTNWNVRSTFFFFLFFFGCACVFVCEYVGLVDRLPYILFLRFFFYFFISFALFLNFSAEICVPISCTVHFSWWRMSRNFCLIL